MKLDFGRTADRIYINAKKSVTLMGRAGGGGGKTGLYLLPVYTIAGNVIGRDAKHGGNQLGINQDVAPTLTSTDRHAVAYAVNEPLPEQMDRWGNDTRKVYADFYIDDKAMPMEALESIMDRVVDIVEEYKLQQ